MGADIGNLEYHFTSQLALKVEAPLLVIGKLRIEGDPKNPDRRGGSAQSKDARGRGKKIGRLRDQRPKKWPVKAYVKIQVRPNLVAHDPEPSANNCFRITRRAPRESETWRPQVQGNPRPERTDRWGLVREYVVEVRDAPLRFRGNA